MARDGAGRRSVPRHRRKVAQLKTRNAAGQMVPLGAFSELKDIVGPDRIQRYDLYSSADIIGAAAPGYSSGQALAAMEEVADHALPNNTATNGPI